jgi:hypothetical protein
MNEMRTLTLLLLLLTTNAIAQSLPDYYPREGFRRTAVIDLVNLDERRIVIGDSSYTLADRVVVRSLSSRSDSLARLRVGTRVAFATNASNQIHEVWLLPDNYTDRRSR